MKFNDHAHVDVGQVQDRRGRGSGGGFSGLPLPIGKAGGGLGIVVLVAVVLIQMFSGSSDAPGSSQLSQTAQDGGTVSQTDLAKVCKTGADANERDDCRAVAVINSVQAYWSNEFAAAGQTYRPSTTVFYSGATPTGCGQGSSSMGPFYCPADQTVYIDLSFWKTLETQFGSNSAPFTQAYVIAHEYGHHVQHLLGISNQVKPGASGPESGTVRLELQADCYAGVWAANASSVPGADGHVLITDITSQDIANAVQTAERIGDDYIQTHLGGGHVDTSSFTHGSGRQREKWLTTGLQTGQMRHCDTFAARDLG